MTQKWEIPVNARILRDGLPVVGLADGDLSLNFIDLLILGDRTGLTVGDKPLVSKARSCISNIITPIKLVFLLGFPSSPSEE